MKSRANSVKLRYPLFHGNSINRYEECMAGAGPASYFWYRETLDIADSIEDPGGISWKVFLSTMAAWILICVCLARGIKSSGKVSNYLLLQSRELLRSN